MLEAAKWLTNHPSLIVFTTIKRAKKSLCCSSQFYIDVCAASHDGYIAAKRIRFETFDGGLLSSVMVCIHLMTKTQSPKSASFSITNTGMRERVERSASTSGRSFIEVPPFALSQQKEGFTTMTDHLAGVPQQPENV